MKVVPPGDDVCPVPPPVDEEPPHDRYCDLVLTGGVASGVVYPWAIVELARAYRFRNIGGTSVGAMAAALAAAAEYGRRTGFEAPFEPLRRLPGALGEELPDGRTRMLSLFQPRPAGRRLMGLWARLFRGEARHERGADAQAAPPPRSVLSTAALVVRAYAVPVGVGIICGQVLTWALTTPSDVAELLRALVVMVLLSLGGAFLAFVIAACRDIGHGVIANNLGLCTGGTQVPQDPDDPEPGLTEWLHEGIQRSAGLKTSDPPLTFRDLWNAPAYPGGPPSVCGEGDPDTRRAINLQVLTTNVTHGRPYRLPLADVTSRLFFRPGDLKPYLPREVLRALIAASPRYAPRSSSDPPADFHKRKFRELPGADLPIVVAARLSLSFPLLFAAVPLYAIDYERRHTRDRRLRRCLFTDGGVSSNFPIHVFDAALPRWPTFGLWLGSRGPYQWLDDDTPLWLPESHLEGRADNWNRFDPYTNPEAASPGSDVAPVGPWFRPWVLLGGFLIGLVTSAKDWRDLTSFRLPHVRNRVARLWLRSGEGGLNIAMPRAQILRMAARYGTAAGLQFVERFCGENGTEKRAWREQRWIRLQLIFRGVRERLNGLATGAAYASHCVPMDEEIDAATRRPPLRDRETDRDRGATHALSQEQADSLTLLLSELTHLEQVLRDAAPQDYRPLPEPELRLRAPL